MIRPGAPTAVLASLIAASTLAAGPVALTGGGAVSANGRTIISIGQPIVGVASAQTAGTPTARFGFVPSAASCPADFNGVNGLTVQDIFDFLAAWFTSDPRTDFNGANGINVQDIFDFLSAWFAGC